MHLRPSMGKLSGSIRFHGLRMTKDHTIPQCEGGMKTVNSCRACNEVKGDMPENDWISFIGTVPNAWRLFEVGGPRGKALLEYYAILNEKSPAPD